MPKKIDRSHVTDAFVAFRLFQHAIDKHERFPDALAVHSDDLKNIARECFGQRVRYREALGHLVLFIDDHSRKDRRTNAIGLQPRAKRAVEALALMEERPTWARLKTSKDGDLVLKPNVDRTHLKELSGVFAPFVRASVGTDGTLELPHFRDPESGLVYCRQSFSRKERERVLAGFWEVDIKNAWPTVVATWYPDRCPTWVKYVEERDGRLDELCAVTHCDRNEAKKQVLRMLNGGALHAPFKEVRWMRDLQREAKQVVDSLGLSFKGGEESNWYKHLAEPVSVWQQSMLYHFGEDVVGMLLVDGCFLANEPSEEVLEEVLGVVRASTGVTFDLKVRRVGPGLEGEPLQTSPIDLANNSLANPDDQDEDQNQVASSSWLKEFPSNQESPLISCPKPLASAGKEKSVWEKLDDLIEGR